MPELPYLLERTVLIKAPRETVFRFFTDTERWASWWGAGSTIDARPGGKVYIRHQGGAVESSGEVVEVAAPERIVFTYGFASGKPIPSGASRVTIRLEPDPEGTRLRLEHEFPERGVRDEHVQGWRFQLSLFANVVANEVFANAAEVVDGWYAAWSIADEKERGEAFRGVIAPGIQFRDRYSLLDGIEDLMAHVGASLRFMPGIGLARKGNIRQCLGTVVADWSATNREGKEMMTGTSVFTLGAGGKIESATSVS
ncbi:MAG TPA: SRPBCC domain-containing protein [Bryobacteraceae bacterium]|nr:SRPBCC domain-containing protein [Bryobacteraceae bacterium]